MLGAPMRALVIEDGSKMAALLRRGLQEEGFAVDVAATGEDGSWLGAENDYVVILLDVMLEQRLEEAQLVALHDLDEDRVMAGRSVRERSGETGRLRLTRAVGRTDS